MNKTDEVTVTLPADVARKLYRCVDLDIRVGPQIRQPVLVKLGAAIVDAELGGDA